MKYFLTVLAFAFVALTMPAFSQEAPPDCSATEAQMKAKPYTKAQGDICIAEWEARVKELQNRLNGLNNAIASLNQTLAAENASLQTNNNDIAKLLEASQRQIEEFGQRLGVLEGKARSMKGFNDAQLLERQEELKSLENDVNKLRSEKIALYPPYFNRIVELAREIRSMYRAKQSKEYIVGNWAEDRDCLWNIAGKAEIYNDPLLWPKVWQANTELIRNPDVIFPGQRLTLPASAPKTADEIKAERSYWRKKRAAYVSAQKKTEETPAPSNPGTIK